MSFLSRLRPSTQPADASRFTESYVDEHAAHIAGALAALFTHCQAETDHVRAAVSAYHTQPEANLLTLVQEQHTAHHSVTRDRITSAHLDAFEPGSPTLDALHLGLENFLAGNHAFRDAMMGLQLEDAAHHAEALRRFAEALTALSREAAANAEAQQHILDIAAATHAATLGVLDGEEHLTRHLRSRHGASAIFFAKKALHEQRSTGDLLGAVATMQPLAVAA